MPRKYLAALGLLGMAAAQMADVPKGHWAEAAVRSLLEKGIFTGFPDGTFRGTQAVSRYEAATMLYRAYLTWTEEVLSRVRKALEESGLAPERVAQALADLEEVKAALPTVQERLEEYGVRLQALGADLEEVRTALLTALEAQAALKPLEERLGGLESSLRRAEEGLGLQRAELTRMEARLRAVEQAVAEMANQVRAGEEARIKEAQATGRRVYALEEKVRGLEESAASRARGEAYAGVGPSGPFGGLRVEAQGARVRVGSDALEASLRHQDLEVAVRQEGGRSEASVRYALFRGIRLVPEVGAGDSNYFYGLLHVEHERQGGVVPGVYARLTGGAGLVGGDPGRYLVEAVAGTSLGPVELELGYGRYFGQGGGDTPYSALSARLAYPGEGWRGEVRVDYAVPHEDIGRDRGLQAEGTLEASLSPFRVGFTLGWRDGLQGRATASYVDRYLFTSATGFYGRLRVGYEVRF